MAAKISKNHTITMKIGIREFFGSQIMNLLSDLTKVKTKKNVVNAGQRDFIAKKRIKISDI